MKVKIDNSGVKVRAAPVHVIQKGVVIRKDLGNGKGEKNVARTHAKKVMAMQRGTLKPSRVLKKKMPTRTRVNRVKTMN